MKPDSAFARFRLSSVWPPLYLQELVKIKNDGESIAIVVDTYARFIFTCDNDEGHREFIFQPIYPEIDGAYSGYSINVDKAINVEISLGLNFSWGGDNVSLLCDGQSILLEKEANGSFFKAKPRIRIALGVKHTLQSIEDFSAASHDEYLFVEVTKELESRLINGKKYDYIKACAIIRQLLIDGSNSIAVRVAKKYGFRLEFNVTIGGVNQMLNLDAFLGSQSFNTRTNGLGVNNLTIRQVVLTYSNVLGGVHMGKPLPKNPEQVELLNTDQIIKVNEREASIETVKVISVIVLNALYPLVDLIVANNKV